MRPPGNADAHEIVLTMSETGGGDAYGNVSTFALGSLTGPINTMFASSREATGCIPTWKTSTIARTRCWPGGSNLVLKPHTIPSAFKFGAAAHSTVRNDCARLTLTLGCRGRRFGGWRGRVFLHRLHGGWISILIDDVIPLQTLRPSTGGKVDAGGSDAGTLSVAYRLRQAGCARPTEKRR